MLKRVDIDLNRIVAYDPHSMEYAANWRYHFTSYTGREIQCVTKHGAIVALRNDTMRKQARGEELEDARANGVVINNGGSYE